jgi:hypothetical protein
VLKIQLGSGSICDPIRRALSRSVILHVRAALEYATHATGDERRSETSLAAILRELRVQGKVVLERVTPAEQSITIAFVGHATAATAELATEYEDQVLSLLDSHGARLLYRGRRRRDQDESLPLEIQLHWFPRREALDAFLADDRRVRLLAFYGDVFTLKQSVELDTLNPLAL